MWKLPLVRRGGAIRHGHHHGGRALSALIFDFGGPVLLTPFELRPIAEASLGLPAGTLGWAGPFDPESDDAWRSFQAGEMTERDYWDVRLGEFCQILGHSATVPEMFAHFYSGTQEQLIRPGAWSLIRDAKAAGIPVGVLTNDLTAFHDQAWIERMTVINEFEAMVDGRRDGVMKPDPAAYRLILDRLGAEAAGSIFIDDQQRNLKGAEAVGLIPVRLDPVVPKVGFRKARDLLDLR